MSMKADFVNPFLNLVIQVWQEKLSVELSFREAEAVSGVFVTDDLTAAVTVHGKLEGNVFYEFPEETSLAIASAVEGEEREVVDESLFAIIESFAEALSVDVALALARAGFASEVASPVLLAKGASVTITRPQIWAHFDSELGSMGVRVSLAEVTS
jgi:CheY-specific phosphatase CheX